MLHYCLTNNKDHLLSILALSAKNLKENMLASDFSKEGFVTAEYDFNFLEKMAAVHPSVVATNKNSGIVEAYALIMDKQFDSGIPVLAPFLMR